MPVGVDARFSSASVDGLTEALVADDLDGEVRSGGDTVVLSLSDREGADGESMLPDEKQVGVEESRCGFIPGYSIVGRLGQGGMGVVYQAIQEKLQRVVALKVLVPGESGNPVFIERFKREAMAVARLNHPNIVTAYDYGEAAGRFFMAIEYVDGVNGDELLDEKGRLSEYEAVTIIRDAVLGLSHALSAGIIHRDVKPANLMLTGEAQRDASGGAMSGRVKVTDLGVAKIRENAQRVERRHTLSSTIMGTPSYMAPEQARGESVDFRGDIYGLGATLYQFLTGLKPFDASTPLKILERQVSDKLTHPQDLEPELGDGICRVLDRMLARSASARYQSYEELLRDLQALVVGQKPKTGTVSEEASSLRPPQFKRSRFRNRHRGQSTPLPFRSRMIATPRQRVSLPRQLLRFLVPLLMGYGIARFF